LQLVTWATISADPVVDTLLDDVLRERVLIQWRRISNQKPSALGTKHLRRYDIYAPVAKIGIQRLFPFEKGLRLGV